MVCINPLYTAPELEYAINKVGAKILLAPKTVAALSYDQGCALGRVPRPGDFETPGFLTRPGMAPG